MKNEVRPLAKACVAPERAGRPLPLTRRDLLRQAILGGAGLAAGWPGAAKAAVRGGPIGNPSAVTPVTHNGNLGAVTQVLNGTGLYIGNEFLNWSDATRQNVFQTIRNWGFNFVCPKVGGYGNTWFSSDQQLRAWRDFAHGVGLNFVPFIYSVPGTYYRDAQICSELGNACGICVVDMEDEWAGYNSQMAAFGNTFRSYNPRTPIIVTGYGDPITRFGANGWPFGQMAFWADAYSPQWYYGVWSVYHNSGVRAAINWGDGQCGQVFGASFPLCPSLSIYSAYTSNGILPTTDITTGEDYARNWRAPIFWWEVGGMNSTLAAACLR